MSRKKGELASKASEYDRVMESLRDQISLHILPPGSKLKENSLANEYNVSRSKIREAFQTLEQRGLIERIPNHGAVVVRLEADEVVQLYDIREMLEALAARLAAQNSTSETWDKFIGLFDESLEHTVEQGDFEAYMQILKSLNLTIRHQANNRILSDFLDHIFDRTQVYARRVVLLPGRAKLGIQLHRKLVDALSRGEGEEAESIKREIVSSAKAYLIRFKEFIL